MFTSRALGCCHSGDDVVYRIVMKYEFRPREHVGPGGVDCDNLMAFSSMFTGRYGYPVYVPGGLFLSVIFGSLGHFRSTHQPGPESLFQRLN